MWIRDALESDANALAELAGRPYDVVLDLIHDRSVRVAVDEAGRRGGDDREDGAERPDDGPEQPDDGPERPDDDDIIGFIAFDARSGTVHVTDFGGATRATSRLFKEPRRFGAREKLDVEVVVPDGDDRRIETVEDAGFVSVGDGPRFDGRTTTRFRLAIERDDG
ncbi:hypothetical protein J2751_001702 [Halorubrum alkaliphilum]|uniref:Uncharacterized protein n=1 Tax=Halorubrum alkaliphilum TaxID=261290 RepID=A0A8T4GG28_9EURY|nr:hypothetical protein [Halorubrum alkaliphilum]MBP1922689.1 hypothetical protein [Halorubrum alkaliphilum]